MEAGLIIAGARIGIEDETGFENAGEEVEEVVVVGTGSFS